MKEPNENYNDLFNSLESERGNVPNIFRYIQCYELDRLNYLLDRLIVFVDSIDEELEDYECGEYIVELRNLVYTLVERWAYIHCLKDEMGFKD